MPIYEFECPIHGRFEKILPLRLYELTKTGIMCDYSWIEENEHWICGKRAEKVVSLTGNIQIAPPSRAFVNLITGESQIAISSYDKAPKGFKEIELKGPIERSKFEKHDTMVQNVINEFDQMRMDDRRTQHQKQRHDDLRARMNAKQTEVFEREDGKIEKVEHFLTPQHKKMLEESMKHSRKKRVPPKVTERMFAVNHMNSSNLQDAPQNKKRAKK